MKFKINNGERALKNLFVNIVCALLIGVFTGSCEKDKDTLKDAQKYFKDNKYEKALSIFLDYIDTECSIARVGAGWCYLRLNDFEYADTMFADAAHDSLLDGFAGLGLNAWGLIQFDPSIDRAYVVLN